MTQIHDPTGIDTIRTDGGTATEQDDEPDRFDPYNYPAHAWKVVLDPERQFGAAFTSVLRRGKSTFEDDAGNLDSTELWNKVDKWTRIAIDEEPSSQEILSDPMEPYDKPGRILLLHLMGVTKIKYHPEVNNNDRRVQIHEKLRKLLEYHAMNAMSKTEFSMELRAYTAESMFKIDKSRAGEAPTGRAITGQVRVEPMDNQVCFEMPLQHASPKKVLRDHSEAATKHDSPSQVDIGIHILNNNVYIPLEFFTERFSDYMDGKAEAAERKYDNRVDEETKLTNGQRESLTKDYIDELLRVGKYDKVFEERQYPRKLLALLRAVYLSPDDKAGLSEWVEADEIADAVRWVLGREPTGDNDDIKKSERIYEWMQNNLENEDLQHGKNIGHYLGSIADEQDHVEVYRSSRVNTYRLEYHPGGNYKQVSVSEVEDLLELPCINNIDQQLKEKKEARQVLIQLARVILEVEGFGVDEVVDFFQRYNWYDPDTTQYQAKYEARNAEQEGTPIGCENDHREWSHYCISKQNCDYSLYQSLPLKQRVFDRLD